MDYLGKVLLKFTENPSDVWTVDDAVKGTSIIGGTGSGKTSASGKTIAHKFLKEGWGGVVLCAKTDEARLWEQYCKATGRGNDLIMFGKGSIHREGEFKGEEMVFNPIDYEMKREGEGAGETQNLTNIFMNIYRMGNRIAGGDDIKEERYWDSALKRCLNRVIELLKLAEEDLSYANMVKVLSTTDTINNDDFLDRLVELEKDVITIENINKKEYCLYCLMKAYDRLYKYNKEPLPEDDNAYNLVEDYFVHTLPRLDDKTKAIVTESFFGLAEPFLAGILHRHFSGKTNLFPECTYKQQKIIVLDFPIKEYLDMGIMAQCVFKQLFQQAVERRNINQYPIPVFLWCDEAQYFVNPYDQIFLTTARSSRTATVFLSQNISNYLSIMNKPKVDSLMGNLCSKLFHANSDEPTNEYASKLIGNALSFLTTSGEQHNSFSITTSYSEGINSQYLPQIQPREFTTLKTGGTGNDFDVQGVLMVSGRQWANGKNYLRVSFKQNFNT